jgi:hypothetical protein
MVCRIKVRNIYGVQARFIAARKKCRSRARSYWLVIDNGHASILATMAAAVASLIDEDIVKMESRTTPIQEGEDDEDIATLDTPTLWSSPSCNSSPT